MKIARLLRRVARRLWTGRYPGGAAYGNLPDRSAEDRIKAMSNEEFAAYLKAYSLVDGFCLPCVEIRSKPE